MNDLEYENGQVLNLVQAMMGGISQNMRLIALLPRGKAAVLRFLLEEDSAEDREEIDDILTEYFALRSSGSEGAVDAEIDIVGQRALASADLEGRVAYIKKGTHCR